LTPLCKSFLDSSKRYKGGDKVKRSIVTICNEDYAPLLKYWSTAVQRVTDLPIFVLCLNGFTPSENENLRFIQVNPRGNPFPKNLPDHACAEKMRLFEHLPHEIAQILFLDLDVLVINSFWDDGHFFGMSRYQLVMCPDLFVGYKEKIEAEFQPYDSSFQMKFNPDGSYFYFNTGVFFASRQAHESWFHQFLNTWSDYVAKQSMYPSIFDQNVFNYCLIRYGLSVHQMSVLNNCLRQYEKQMVKDGRILLNGQTINAYHFNGGNSAKKLERWQKMLSQMGGTHDNSQS